MKPALFLLMVLGVGCYGQTVTGKAETKGTCSPAVTGSKNTFTITCGIGEEQGAELLKIVNKILANQGDLKEFGGKLDEILRGINQIRETSAQRHLTDEQKSLLLSLLASFAHHKVTITCIWGDVEGKAYAMDFVEVFRKAGWTGVEGMGTGQAMFDSDPVGVAIKLNSDDVAENKLPADANVIATALKQAGVAVEGIHNRQIQRSEFELIIGSKPLPR
jgi:hypothetical protein